MPQSFARRVPVVLAVAALVAGTGCEPKELNRFAAWWRGVIVSDGVGTDPIGPPQYYKGVGATQSHQSCVDAAMRRGARSELDASIACEVGAFFIEGAQGFLP